MYELHNELCVWAGYAQEPVTPIQFELLKGKRS